MTAEELRPRVLDALASVAPEVADMELDPTLPLRDQLDIDSMDFLNFVVALHTSIGVEVPESDYAQIASVDACAKYLAAKLDG
jgi:acyl carrier protein